jgi:hypothetical protein
MSLEVVESRSPHEAIGSEPVVELAQGCGAHPIEAPLSIAADLYQTRLAEDTEVLGNPGLAYSQGADQLADGPLGLPQEVEDLTAAWLSENLECLTHGASIFPNGYIAVKATTRTDCDKSPESSEIELASVGPLVLS